jgi:hypothetical protein
MNPKTPSQSFFTSLGENRFGLLFVSLLLTISGSTILAELGFIWLNNLLILLNLLVLLSIITGRWTLRAGVVFFFLSLFYTVTSSVFELKTFTFEPYGQLSSVILLFLGTLTCFRVIFRSGRIDRERLFASLSLYLLFGLIFAIIFVVVEELLPGSFRYPGNQSPGSEIRPLVQLIYFSYVTLATLGYGDIVPVSGPAKGLVILEAIIGQMYLVVVVARLVSLYEQTESKE